MVTTRFTSSVYWDNFSSKFIGGNCDKIQDTEKKKTIIITLNAKYSIEYENFLDQKNKIKHKFEWKKSVNKNIPNMEIWNKENTKRNELYELKKMSLLNWESTKHWNTKCRTQKLQTSWDTKYRNDKI